MKSLDQIIKEIKSNLVKDREINYTEAEIIFKKLDELKKEDIINYD